MSGELEVREHETVGVPALIRPDGEVVEGSGVDIDLSDPVACAVALDRVRQFEQDFGQIKRVLTEAVVAHYRLTGERSLELPNRLRAEVKAGTRTLVDPDVLEERLREAGMPEERIEALITTTQERRVDLRKAKAAGTANPEYKAALEAASSTYAETPSVTIRRR
jgi:hypothetical protein